MLIDDNPDDNFFHERVIKRNHAADMVITYVSAIDALEHLKSKAQHVQAHPNVILLDVNMPGMNGWEFIREYEKLDKDLQGNMIVVMLSNSHSSDNKEFGTFQPAVFEFKTKPLTKEILDEILDKYWSM